MLHLGEKKHSVFIELGPLTLSSRWFCLPEITHAVSICIDKHLEGEVM